MGLAKRSKARPLRQPKGEGNVGGRGGLDSPAPPPPVLILHAALLAPSMMIEALFAASCNDLDDRWL